MTDYVVSETPPSTVIHLWGYDDDGPNLGSKAYMAWGQLVKIAAPVMQFHHADLAYDLDDLRKLCADSTLQTVTFYWGVDVSGTVFSADRSYALMAREKVWQCTFEWTSRGEYLLHMELQRGGKAAICAEWDSGEVPPLRSIDK